ncbi:retrovirus-related pol polyprotein from transposon TNT 1-94 [Tanacetum coccineum]
MMSFLNCVVTSRYPTTNNQLRTSSNPLSTSYPSRWKKKWTVQPVQGRQTTYAGCEQQENTTLLKKWSSFIRGRNSIFGRSDFLDIQNSRQSWTTMLLISDDRRPMDLIVMTQLSKIVSWPISQGMAQMHVTEYLSGNTTGKLSEFLLFAQQGCPDLSMFDQIKNTSDALHTAQMERLPEIKNEILIEKLALEKKLNQLDNIIFKRGQSAQTVHMMTKSKICYDHSSKQAIGFEKPFYLKKARESKPKLYDGNTILKMDTIVIPDSDETLELSEESHSKMLLKEQDPLFKKHRVNTKPINYAILNNDYYKRFVRQTNLYCEHAYWKAIRSQASDPSPFFITVISSSKRTSYSCQRKNHCHQNFTEGHVGAFDLSMACFQDEIIPFIKELKDIFNNFNQYLVEELADVQKVFYQMEQAVEQHRLESRTFEVKINQVLSENERLLAQAIDKDIVKTVVNLSVNASGETVNECQKCLELKTELLNKKDFVDKETYEKLCKSFTTLEKHCITLEADSQLNQEIFQQENSVLNQNAPSFTQLFELSELRAQSQAKDTVIVKLKEQIKSLKGNVEMYSDAFNQTVNIKSGKISDLNAKLQEQGLVIAALKNKLRKLKGKALDIEDLYTKVIQDLLSHISRSCPSINNCGPQLIEVTQRKKDKKLGVRLSTSASGSQPSGNTRNDRILQTPSSYSKNKVEAHPRNVKSSLNKRNGTVKVNGPAVVQNLKKQDNSDYVCINHDDCMSSDNLCVSNSMNDVKFRAKPKKNKSKKDIWKPTGKVLTQIGYIWRPSVLDSDSPKPVVKLVYSRKPRKNKNTEPVSKTKVLKPMSSKSSSVFGFWLLEAYEEDRRKLTNISVNSWVQSKFGNDQVAKIMGFGDYQIGNVTISRCQWKESSFLVIVESTTSIYWVKCLRSKDEAPAFIINFLKMIQIRLKETVRRIRTDNGTEFVNQTLREYYEKVDISHETSVARSPQQNGVVERRNRTLIEVARTMLIYAKAPLFLWAEAVATACYTQNRSMIRRRHGKTPYELLHDKPPDLSYLYVFGALCYPTNDSENLGKLQPRLILFQTSAQTLLLQHLCIHLEIRLGFVVSTILLESLCNLQAPEVIATFLEAVAHQKQLYQLAHLRLKLQSWVRTDVRRHHNSSRIGLVSWSCSHVETGLSMRAPMIFKWVILSTFAIVFRKT